MRLIDGNGEINFVTIAAWQGSMNGTCTVRLSAGCWAWLRQSVSTFSSERGNSSLLYHRDAQCNNRGGCGGTHDGFPIARDVARTTAQPLSGGVQFERSV